MEPAPLPPPDPAPSLAQRVAGWRHRAPAATDEGKGGRRGLALALLLPLGPLLTLGGATWMAARQEVALAVLEATPRARAATTAEQEAQALRRVARSGGVASRIERLARVLPADDRLTSASQALDGGMKIEVATADPDRLRAALRRDPVLAALHGEGERRGDGVLVVTLAGRP